MSRVVLDNQQEILKESIENNLNKLKQDIRNPKLDYKKILNIYDTMAMDAHKLHMSLDPKPKHHRYMIENRGLLPESEEFYKHIHPVEDLLKYLEDTSANNDPEDATIGSEFFMTIYSRRWGSEDRYSIKRNEDGWSICFMHRYTECTKDANPGLYKLLDHDSINYPEELPGYMEYLWEQAKEQGLSKEEVQYNLDIISNWISICEQSSPDGIFGGYK
ncbi:MAG: hypothetical protein ACRCXT_14675 [Paraclostridium sp.]